MADDKDKVTRVKRRKTHDLLSGKILRSHKGTDKSKAAQGQRSSSPQPLVSIVKEGLYSVPVYGKRQRYIIASNSECVHLAKSVMVALKIGNTLQSSAAASTPDRTPNRESPSNGANKTT